MHIVSESDPRRMGKEGLVNGAGWKSRRPDSHTERRESGQIPIRLLYCVLSSRVPSEV